MLMKLKVLLLLQATSFLKADVQTDLVQLQVGLENLSKMVPKSEVKEPIKPEIKPEPIKVVLQPAEKGPVPPSDYNKWVGQGLAASVPADIKLTIPGGETISLATWIDKNPDKDIPIDTALQLPGPQSPRLKVTVGKKGYSLWEKNGFQLAYFYLDQEDYSRFKPGVKIEVRVTPLNIVTLIVGQDKNIANLLDYTDENGNLLGVTKLYEPGSSSGKVLSSLSQKLFTSQFNDLIESLQ